MLKCEIIGHLGADARVANENGKSFISFNVAHTDKWTDAQGMTHDQTQWVSCIINDATSKVLPFLRKGKQVFVRGNLSARVFSSEKQRAMVAGLTINVREVELVGAKVEDKPTEVSDQQNQEQNDKTF